MSSILRCLPVIKSHHAGHLLNSLQHQKALFLNPRYIRSVFVIIKKPRTINCAAFLLGPYFLASKKIKGLLIRLAIGFISSCNPFRNDFFFHCCQALPRIQSPVPRLHAHPWLLMKLMTGIHCKTFSRPALYPYFSANYNNAGISFPLTPVQ